MMTNPLFNLAVAWLNILAAVYWLACGELHGVAFSCAGALCSLKAVELCDA